jgi:hypothetical protein
MWRITMPALPSSLRGFTVANGQCALSLRRPSVVLVAQKTDAVDLRAIAPPCSGFTFSQALLSLALFTHIGVADRNRSPSIHSVDGGWVVSVCIRGAEACGGLISIWGFARFWVFFSGALLFALLGR